MGRSGQNDPYLHVSNIYSHLMNFISYKWWAKYIFSIVEENLANDPFVLEIGAGNCMMGKYFEKLYPKYMASDISLSMLLKSEKYITRICCDMRSLPFKNKFDLIISTFDAVNYLTNKKDLLKTFKEIKNILSDNGCFTFDAALESNSYKHENSANGKWRKSGFTYERKSSYSSASRIHKNTFKIKYPDGNVITEIHRQKIYPLETFYEAADKSGLKIVNCYKAFTKQKGNANSDRVQFIMKKGI